MIPCKVTSFGAKVCLIAYNKPLIGDGNPKRLPILAVKVSTGKAVEKGIEHYLTAPWKEGWEDWLRQAKEAFPSVLEHIVLTFHIDGCSRVCSHQLVRHRLVSFTQESQRYSEVRILKAYGANDLKEAQKIAKDHMYKMFDLIRKYARGEMSLDEVKQSDAFKACKKLVVIPPSLKEDNKLLFCLRALIEVSAYLDVRAVAKMSLEDARYLLPQAIRTSLLATANLREWFHVIELRAHPKAQWEIREIAEGIKELIERVGPRSSPA